MTADLRVCAVEGLPVPIAAASDGATTLVAVRAGARRADVLACAPQVLTGDELARFLAAHDDDDDDEVWLRPPPPLAARVVDVDDVAALAASRSSVADHPYGDRWHPCLALR